MIKQVGMIQPPEELNLQMLIVAASILVFFLITAAAGVELQINATINATQGAWGGYYAGECLNVTMLQNGSQWLVNVTGVSS